MLALPELLVAVGSPGWGGGGPDKTHSLCSSLCSLLWSFPSLVQKTFPTSFSHPSALSQYWPLLAPETPIAHLERNSLGKKRAQAAVRCVLYTMNIFAFASRLKIMPPVII